MTENPESGPETNRSSVEKTLDSRRRRNVRRREPEDRPRERRSAERSPEWPFAPTPRETRSRATPDESPRLDLQTPPDIDIAELPNEIHVWCDLPGCDEETVELSGNQWTLHVSAERADKYWEESNICRRERSKQAERSINLPARTDIDAVEATFDDGVLMVRAPKHESEHTRGIGIE